MSECAHHSSCPWLQKAADIPRSTSARSAVPLPNRLLSPGCVVSSAAEEPSRPGFTTVARFDANACRLKPQSVAELTNSQDRSEEHTSELQSPCNLVCRLLLEKKYRTATHPQSAGTRAAASARPPPPRPTPSTPARPARR